MGYTFRTPGPWGPGLGSDLSPAQVDNNFWQAIQDIQAKAAQGVGISDILVSGNQMTVVLTDHTYLGPYTLPTASFSFRGEWQPSTAYSVNEVITHAGSTYMVLVNHTSAATFDPGANDGHGNNYYGLLLSNPANVLPTGGPTGRFLRKASATDYAVAWETAALEDLSDIAVHTPANGQALMYESGVWQNLTLPEPTLEQLTDVAVTTPTDGQVLTYTASASNWENKTISLALSSLTDVSISTATPPVAGQPLVYNGTAWTDASTVDMPCGGLQSVTGSITINRSAGEVQRLLINGTVTLTAITGWPAGGHFARLVLEVQNSGPFGLAWPSNVIWPGGTVPGATVNGKDIFILVSFDGGTTIYGNVAGQNYH